MENLSTDTSHIREWRSIITLIAFFLASKYRHPSSVVTGSPSPLVTNSFFIVAS